MADGRVYLDSLNSNSTNYKVKVKVVQKGKPQRSARDVLYQTVVLQDDKGNKMRGTLFGDQISGHVDALVSNGVYEIANAPIKTLPDQYRRDPTELPYTMGFGRQTFIHPLSTPETCLPEYLCVSQVPKTATQYDIFDVIGTLLYVEPRAREVTTKQGRKNTVREIILTDHGTEQPVAVSAWNELSDNECEQLASLVTSLPVIGFTGLRVSPFRGFSLTSTMSTVIDASPVGPKADNLKEWVSRSMGYLTDLQARVNKVRDPNTAVPVVKLRYLKNKKAKNTLQDERYQLSVTVPVPELQKVNAYLGCSHCGKRTEYVAGETFKCETCTKDNVVSEPRITFNCEVSDGTDQLEITTFTADTETLFQMSASEIFHLKHSLNMRPRRKHIRELSGPTGPYTIRAKVVEKTNVHSEPDGQGLELQIITFEDEEGTKMRTFLDQDELEIFEDIIQDDMEYDISNVQLKLDADASLECSGGQMFDLFFNMNTIVQPVSDEATPATSNYILIGSIPRKVTLDTRYDVLGVVIYVDRCGHPTANQGQTSEVCEVLIVDHSHEQVLILTAWSDLPLAECWALHSIVTSFPVVGFTALMPSYQKGFSLSTTHSTFVILDPPGKEADSLREWAAENKTLLYAKRQHVYDIRHPGITRAVTTIASLLNKGANNTLQEERHWLHVILHQFDPKDVHFYLGCSNCGTGGAEEMDVPYMCAGCLQEGVTSAPRMAATFEVADDTGMYTFSAYTENMERLLELKAHILYSMNLQERKAYLEYTASRFRTNKLYVQVVPTADLSRIQELKWVLQKISLN